MPDPRMTPKLSQSIAKTLIYRSPLAAWWEHPELGGHRRAATDDMDVGNLAHELILGGDRVQILFYNDWRTNKAKAERAAVREAGGVPILAKKRDAMEPICDRIRKTLVESGLDPAEFECEKRISWTHGGVECEGTPDAVLVGETSAIAWDLKTTKKLSSHEDLGKHAASSGWALQRAAYVSALETLHPEVAGRVSWLWVVAEMEFPHDVVIVPPGASMIELGEREWDRAVVLWKRLIDGGWCEPWRGLSSAALEAPAWRLTQEAIAAEELVGGEA